MSKIPDYSGTKNRSIAVYCWSRTEPGTPLWAQAESIGRLAAENGFSVITGGYCGSMEAVSKGAREVIDAGKASKVSSSDPDVVGVVVSQVFPDRALSGNKYLTVTKDSSTMMNRVEQLTSLSRYYVILPGTLGTLQELTCIWTLSLIHPKGEPRPVIIAFREPWKKCLEGIAECLHLPKEQLQLITFVDTPEEAMEVIKKDDAELRSSSSSAN